MNEGQAQAAWTSFARWQQQSLNDWLSSVERATQTGGGDQAEWLDRWLEALQHASTGPGKLKELPDLLASGMEHALHFLNTPALGYGRERQAEYQAFLSAQLEWQQANGRYMALLARLPAATTKRLRDRLAQMEGQPGAPINSLRALYDLWVDAAEEAFAELAFSAEFQSVYGELINATMRYRKAANALLEPQLRLAGIPTAAALAQTTRQLHALRREVAALKRSQKKHATPAEKTQRKKAAKPRKKKVKSS